MLYDRHGPCAEWLAQRQVIPSFIQRIPGAVRRHRLFLPLMPLAVEQFDLNAFDVIVSSSYAVAKGVLTRADQRHIAYVHAPLRYAWDLYHLYLQQTGLDHRPSGIAARLLLHYLRLWDRLSADRADVLLANSAHTAARIAKTYRREAQVVYPPVDVDYFTPGELREDFYLTVSRLVPYKRIDLIVQAFAGMPERRLVVVGDGPERRKLQALAGDNVRFLGFQPRHSVRELMRQARAFVFAAWEDFGITPVEAQACGTPVIAYQHGGALETVVEGVSGLFFPEASPHSLIAAVRALEALPALDPAAIRSNALRFSRARFQEEMANIVNQGF
jgi:glycosyltransferase involved in cell wall biosynthesis